MLVQLCITLLIVALSTCNPECQLSVEEILDKVEAADISSVTATVSYTRTDPLLFHLVARVHA